MCAPHISADEVSGFAAAIRRPPVLWDNYPVNDLAMHDEMHIDAIAHPKRIGGRALVPLAQFALDHVPAKNSRAIVG